MVSVQKFILFPNIATLSKFQREEYAKLWFDLAKISAGSLVVKAFEPGGPVLDFRTIMTVTAGLIIFWLCVRVGLYVAKE